MEEDDLVIPSEGSVNPPQSSVESVWEKLGGVRESVFGKHRIGYAELVEDIHKFQKEPPLRRNKIRPIFGTPSRLKKFKRNMVSSMIASVQ